MPPINRDERQPVVSGAPTLLLSGAFESGTPPAFGEAVVQSRFFDDPLKPPNTRCLVTMPKFRFAAAR